MEAEALILRPHDTKEPTHWKRLWCWERLKVGEEQQRMRWFDSITNSMDMNLSKLQKTVEDRAWHAAHGVAKSQTQLSNWKTIMATKTNNNKNKVGSLTMKRHGEKCTLLTERSQYEKVTYYIIPNIWHSGKDHRDSKKDQRLPGVWAGGEMNSHKFF